MTNTMNRAWMNTLSTSPTMPMVRPATCEPMAASCSLIRTRVLGRSTCSPSHCIAGPAESGSRKVTKAPCTMVIAGPISRMIAQATRPIGTPITNTTNRVDRAALRFGLPVRARSRRLTGANDSVSTPAHSRTLTKGTSISQHT